jgi:hypothetical protein
VYRDINALFHERPLQLGRESSFAPFRSIQLAWGGVLMVASHANDFGRYLDEGPGSSQRFLNHSGLRQCQFTSASAENDFLSRRFLNARPC